jgi:hypothetical protein
MTAKCSPRPPGDGSTGVAELVHGELEVELVAIVAGQVGELSAICFLLAPGRLETLPVDVFRNPPALGTDLTGEVAVGIGANVFPILDEVLMSLSEVFRGVGGGVAIDRFACTERAVVVD